MRRGNKETGSVSTKRWFDASEQQMFVFSGEAALPDRRPPRGDAIGRPELLPPDLPGGGASDGHQPSLRLDRLQEGDEPI